MASRPSDDKAKKTAAKKATAQKAAAKKTPVKKTVTKKTSAKKDTQNRTSEKTHESPKAEKIVQTPDPVREGLSALFDVGRSISARLPDYFDRAEKHVNKAIDSAGRSIEDLEKTTKVVEQKLAASFKDLINKRRGPGSGSDGGPRPK